MNLQSKKFLKENIIVKRKARFAPDILITASEAASIDPEFNATLCNRLKAIAKKPWPTSKSTPNSPNDVPNISFVIRH